MKVVRHESLRCGFRIGTVALFTLMISGPELLAQEDDDRGERRRRVRDVQVDRELEQAWEAWAEQYSKRWEDWAERTEKDWESWAHRYEQDWEAWGEDYGKAWEAWGKRIEDGEEPDIDEILRLTTESLGRMPLDGMMEQLGRNFENMGEIDAAGGMEGLDELIKLTVESSLAGLEHQDIQADVQKQVRKALEQVQRATGDIRSAVEQRRGAVDQRSAERWQALEKLLQGRGKVAKEDYVRALKESDELRRRIESIRERVDQGDQAEVVTELRRKRDAIQKRDRELDALRDQVEELRREIERLRREKDEKADREEKGDGGRIRVL